MGVVSSPQLTFCQQNALRLLEESIENVFLTGSAGSGKSFLIRQFLKGKDRKSFPVVASTGAAAVLIGGRTFHSFFGLGIMAGGYERTVTSALTNRRIVNRLKKIDGFVLDEVSMIPAPALRAAEEICRRARGEAAPWGGVRVIAVGDFAQLPPVQTAGGQQKEWAFLDPVWEQSALTPAILKTIVRTPDEEYIRILNRIREGIVDDEVEAYLNRKVDCDAVDSSQTHLFARRHAAEKFNRERVEAISHPLVEVPTNYSGRADAIERIKKVAPIPDVLHIKLTSLVMLRYNDPKWRFVNGTVGTVEDIADDELVLSLKNGRVVEIPKMTFTLLDGEGKPLASAENFPVTLAYATTIHKAQGATLESLVVKLSGLWDPGQAYVALSRLRSGADLTLTGWDHRSISVDPEVVRFHQGLERD